MIKEKGSINDKSVIRLLLKVFEEDITGILHVKRESIQKTLYFKKGKLEYAESNSDLDKLENILISEKLIEKEKLEVVKNTIETPESLGKTLVEEGLIPLEKLVSTIKRQLKMIILGILKWKEGSFQYEATTPPENQINLDLNIIDFIINHILTNLQESYIMQEMQLHTSPYKRNPDNIKISKFNLSDKQKELLNSFSTEKKIDAVLSKFPDVHRASLSKIIYFFIVSNLLIATEEELSLDTSEDDEMSISDELIDNQLVEEAVAEEKPVQESETAAPLTEEETPSLDLPLEEQPPEEPVHEAPAEDPLSVELPLESKSEDAPIVEEPPAPPEPFYNTPPVAEPLPDPEPEPPAPEPPVQEPPMPEPTVEEIPAADSIPSPEPPSPEPIISDLPVESNQVAEAPPDPSPVSDVPSAEESIPVSAPVEELPPEPPQVEDHSAADLPPIIMGRMGKIPDAPPDPETDFKTLENELKGATLESAFVLDQGGEETFKEKVSTTKFLKGEKIPAGEKKKSKLFNYILIAIMMIFLIGGSIVIFVLPEEKIEDPVTQADQHVVRPRRKRPPLQKKSNPVETKTGEETPEVSGEQTPAAAEEKESQTDTVITGDDTKDITGDPAGKEKTEPGNDPEPVKETPVTQTEEPKPVVTRETPPPTRSAMEFFLENNYRAATRLWRQELEANNIQFSILLEMDCMKESVQNAYNQVQSKDKFLIIERIHDGRTCYLVLWGKYTDRKRAEDELPTVSRYFWQQSSPPRVVDLSIYL